MRDPQATARTSFSLILLPLLAALALSAPAEGQEHDHGDVDLPAERQERAYLGGVPREFLGRPIAMNEQLTRVPHHVDSTSDEALAYYQQGLAYLYLYHRLNAVRSFNHALRLDPSLLPAYAGLSRALAAHGARSEGGEALRRGQRVLEELGEAADPVGRLLVELRAQAIDASTAEEREAYRDALNRAVEEHPDDIELRMIQALNAQGEERPERLHGVIARIPGHVGAHHELIHYHEGRRQTEAAVEHGAILAELAPTVAHGRHMYGHNLIRMGRVDEAKRQFAAADSLERAHFAEEDIPEHYDWHHPHNLHLLALSYWHLGRVDEAEAALRRRAALADRQGRERLSFLVQLGELMVAEARENEALALAEHLLDPGGRGSGSTQLRVQGHLLAAEAHLLRGELEEARSAFASADELVTRGRGGFGVARWKDRVELQLGLHAGAAADSTGEFDDVVSDLLRDRGPDGWITSLLHLHALAQSAAAAGADYAARRLIRVMEEHDPSFTPRIASTGAAARSPDHAAARTPDGASGATRELQVHPVERRVDIDGRLSDPSWAAAPVASGFVQQVPRPGRPATLETEARVLMSEDAVYVGVRLHDSAPDSIVAQLARRGVENESDWVYVAFDSQLDRRSAFEFGVNAAGVKREVRITDDTRRDASWEAVWDVEVSMHDGGWNAEFRIPLSQLRFADSDVEQTWGFNVRREVARTGEVSLWTPVERGSASYVSGFGTLSGIYLDRGARRVELLPYLTSRVERAPGDPQDPYFRSTDLGGGAGVDLRVGLTSWLTLDATINPDFGQVGADPSVVNLSAFEVSLPERRPFFVEGAEHFNTPGANLFYSRRIGRAPQLRAPAGATFTEQLDRTTILGATKVTGRSPGGWPIGALTALTAEERVRYTTADGEETHVVEPRTSYSFARTGRDFRGGRSAVNVSGTWTNRFLDELPQARILHDAAYAAGVDARHRFFGDELEVSGTLHLSRVQGDSLALARTQRAPGRYFHRPDAKHVAFHGNRTSLGGHSSSLRFAKVAGGNWRTGIQLNTTSPGFEVNDLGLQFAVDRRSQSAWLRYDQFAAGRHLRSWSVSVNQAGVWTTGGERVDMSGTLDVNGELRNRWHIGLWGMRHRGGVNPDHLRGGPAYFAPGRWMWRTTVSTDRQRSFSANASLFATADDEGEGGNWDLSGGVLWRPSDRSDLRLTPSISRRASASQFVAQGSVGGGPRYVLSEIDQTTVSLGVRLNYALSPDLSFELHARPFVAAGRFDGFQSVVPEAAGERARRKRLAAYTPDQLEIVESAEGRRTIEIDDTGDGAIDLRIPHPDFNRKDLRATAVLRWEYRPGSTFYLVWSHDRSRFDPDGRFDLSRDLDLLRGAPGRSILAVKGTHRIEL